MTVGHVGQDFSGSHADGQKSAHTHAHAPNTFGTAFAIGTVLNTAFVLVEVGAGLAGNSTALLADAGHNLSDVLGLLVAWGAAALSGRGRRQSSPMG